MSETKSVGSGLGTAVRLSILASIAGFVFISIQHFVQNLTLIHTGIALVDGLVSGAVAFVITLLLVLGFLESAVPGLKKMLGLNL